MLPFVEAAEHGALGDKADCGNQNRRQDQRQEECRGTAAEEDGNAVVAKAPIM